MTGPATNTQPVDIQTMRATAQRILGPDDTPGPLTPSGQELDTLTRAVRRHLELLTPEVEQAANKLAHNSIPRVLALACVGEARRKLQANPAHSPHGPTAYARRLARVLITLTDHHKHLTSRATR